VERFDLGTKWRGLIWERGSYLGNTFLFQCFGFSIQYTMNFQFLKLSMLKIFEQKIGAGVIFFNLPMT